MKTDTDRPPTGPPPYGLWHAYSKTWLGDARGPRQYTDWLLTRAAATIATEQLGSYVLPRPLAPAPYRLKDEVPTLCTPTEAVAKIIAKA